MLQNGFLTNNDIQWLTGAAWSSRQEAWLKAESIPYKKHGSRVIVCWTHVEAYIEGKSPVIAIEPDLSNVH
jgi:hypothetical protein